MERFRSRANLGWMLDRAAREYPSRVAIVDQESHERRSFAELRNRSLRGANALASLGIGRGETVGLLAHNCIEYIEVIFAAARVGATVVLVNRRLTVPEMANELTASQVKGVIFSPKYATEAAELKRSLAEETWWCSTGPSMEHSMNGVSSYETLLGSADDLFEPEFADDLSDLGVVIIFTSGTTGKPKGAVLSQANLLAAVSSNHWFNSRYESRLQPRLRQLLMVGLNHIAGLCAVAFPTIAAGGELIILDDFDPLKAVKAIEEHSPNFVFGIGTLWDEILKLDLTQFDLSSVELIISCVTYLPPERLRQLEGTFGAEIFMTFGQTETSTFPIATRATVDLYERPRTVGRPLGYVETRLMTEAGSVADVGQVGELQYRGPSIFNEYYGDPDATNEAFAEDGWFRSGDLLYADADGYLYFVDRTKDVIKSGGLNVYAFEVEQTIETMPEVASAAVVGIPHEKWGEAVTAFVVLHTDAQLDPTDVTAWCHGRLASYKIPKTVLLVDDLPVNSLGKKLKRQLVSEYLKAAGSSRSE